MSKLAPLTNDDVGLHSAMQATTLLATLIATIVTGASLLLA